MTRDFCPSLWPPHHRIRLLLCVTLALLPGIKSGPVHADDSADQNVYTDYIAGSWDDWSFNSTKLMNDTEHVHSFNYAGKISFTQTYGALDLHFRGFDTRAFDSTGYTDLVFAIHWGDAPPQALLIYALRNHDFNKIFAKPPIAQYVTSGPDDQGWFTYDVPLSHLGVANVTDFTDILLTGPDVNKPFWIDDVKIVKAPGPSRVSVQADVTKPLRMLDGRHLGINAATWDSTLTNTQTASLLQAAGARFFRFPGGSIADQYDWQSNTWGPVPRQGTVRSTKGDIDTAHFLAMVQQAGGQALITANYGTGTAADAAAWVSFCNVQNHFNVKYWEVGQENWQSSEDGSHDPKAYAAAFALFSNAMKAVDPTIKVGMVGPFNASDTNNWAPTVLTALSAAKELPDFYAVHYYPEQEWSGTPHEDDADLLQYPKDWQTIAASVRSMLNTAFGSTAAGIEIMATENNSTGAPPGKQTVSLVNGLYLADSLGQALETEITSFMWWDLHNSYDAKNNNSPVLYGFRDFGDYGLLSANDPGTPANTPYPTYYALQLWSQVAGPGSVLVSSSSNESLLPVYAAIQPDGRLAMMVINKSTEEEFRVPVNATGITPSKVHVAQYGVFEDAIGVGPFQYDFFVTGPSFLFAFPSYSITVLTLQP